MTTFNSLSLIIGESLAVDALTSYDRCYVDLYDRVLVEWGKSYYNVCSTIIKALMRIVTGLTLYDNMDFGHERAVGFNFTTDHEYLNMIHIVHEFWKSDAGKKSKTIANKRTLSIIKKYIHFNVPASEVECRIAQCWRFGLFYFKNYKYLYEVIGIKSAQRRTRRESWPPRYEGKRKIKKSNFFIGQFVREYLNIISKVKINKLNWSSRCKSAEQLSTKKIPSWMPRAIFCNLE